MLTHTVLELIGNTPLIRLNGENIFAKAEFLNPGGSISPFKVARPSSRPLLS